LGFASARSEIVGLRSKAADPAARHELPFQRARALWPPEACFSGRPSPPPPLRRPTASRRKPCRCGVAATTSPASKIVPAVRIGGEPAPPRARSATRRRRPTAFTPSFPVAIETVLRPPRRGPSARRAETAGCRPLAAISVPSVAGEGEPVARRHRGEGGCRVAETSPPSGPAAPRRASRRSLRNAPAPLFGPEHLHPRSAHRSARRRVSTLPSSRAPLQPDRDRPVRDAVQLPNCYD